MKSFESRLEVLEAARAKRRIARLTKMQRDQAVEKELKRLKMLAPNKREKALQSALQACRADKGLGGGSQEQREAAVKAAFNSFA